MRRVERFLGLIDNLSEWVGRIVAPLMLVIMASVVFEVMMRYFFNKPTIWVHEGSAMLFGGYFILAGAYVLRHRRHVIMDILYSHLSLRTRAILDLVGSPLFFLFCGVMLWYGWGMAWHSLAIGQVTESFWKPPLYPLKFTIPVGAFLILLQGSAWFTRNLFIAITGREAA